MVSSVRTSWLPPANVCLVVAGDPLRVGRAPCSEPGAMFEDLYCHVPALEYPLGGNQEPLFQGSFIVSFTCPGSTWF